VAFLFSNFALAAKWQQVLTLHNKKPAEAGCLLKIHVSLTTI